MITLKHATGKGRTIACLCAYPGLEDSILVIFLSRIKKTLSFPFRKGSQISTFFHWVFFSKLLKVGFI